MADNPDLHIIDINNEGQESSTIINNNVAAEKIGESEHPWPYLSSIFRYKGRQDNSVKLVCLLCSPLYKEICAFITSPSNLRKHVEVRKLWLRLYSIKYPS